MTATFPSKTTKTLKNPQKTIKILEKQLKNLKKVQKIRSPDGPARCSILLDDSEIPKKVSQKKNRKTAKKNPSKNTKRIYKKQKVISFHKNIKINVDIAMI
jgi:hypothetical protein